jgi:hypothetical protein
MLRGLAGLGKPMSALPGLAEVAHLGEVGKMKICNALKGMACFLFAIAGWAVISEGATVSVLPPWPESPLRQYAFDEPLSPTNTPQRLSQTALDFDRAVWAESWTGYALNRVGTSLAAVRVPVLTGESQFNLGPGEGTVRFWFCPTWRSGRGQGHPAKLLELSTGEAQTGAVWWSLGVDSQGTALVLEGETPDGWATLLRAPIAWNAGGRHLIA